LYAVSGEPVSFLGSRRNRPYANITLGWDQAANGNLGESAQTLSREYRILTSLGWPQALGLNTEPGGTGKDIWKFGGINGTSKPNI
jgi:hypothetical protein